MNIVKISGGLGNQMFQYMFGIALGEDTKFDISLYQSKKIHNGFELEKVFKNIKIPICTIQERMRLRRKYIMLYGQQVSLDLAEKMIFGKNILFQPKTSHIKELINNQFNPFYLEQNEEKYFEGYWASEKYFKSTGDLYKSIFRFSDFNDTENKNMAKMILHSNSISLHVRRGDFVKGKRCIDDSFWYRAIEIFKTEKDAHFFVFSDDIDYCKKLFSEEKNFTYVEHNNKENSFRDMQLMSYCKHNIISNSTFSWWGAMLNANYKKCIVCPKKSPDFPQEIKGDYFCDKWIQI